MLQSQVIVELEAIINDQTTDFDPTAAGTKVPSRDKLKTSPRWFELSAEALLPGIAELTKLRRQEADLFEAAKIRWIEKKVEEMKNKYDPRGAWKVMREFSAMFTALGRGTHHANIDIAEMFLNFMLRR